MLEWIWFVILTFAAIASSLTMIRSENEGGPTLGAFGFGTGAVYLSWPVLGQPAYDLLDRSLTQYGTGIHTITVWVLIGLLVLAYMIAVTLLPIIFMEAKRKPLTEKQKSIEGDGIFPPEIIRFAEDMVSKIDHHLADGNLSNEAKSEMKKLILSKYSPRQEKE